MSDSVCKVFIYTCPMHPEIEQESAGSCPKCGMALEPMNCYEATTSDELIDMSRRFWFSLFLSVPVFFVSMYSDLFPSKLPDFISMSFVQWFSFVLATPVVLWGGWPFFVRGWVSLKTWQLNMFTLIAIGVATSWTYSIFALLAPSIFPPLMQTAHGLVHVYFEASAMIITLVLLGQVLELKARSKTNSAIETLLNLAPKMAHKIDQNDEEKEIRLEDVQVGDRLRIKPGEKIPVDGTVLQGESNVDESMISGEPLLIAKTVTSKIIGATLNTNGTLIMQATHVGNDTMLAQIIEMVASAQRSRAPIQKLVDKVSAYFVPAVVLTSILAFFIWWIWGPQPQLAYALVAAVATLIIACPCALGLATPISIMVGTGRAALSGILIKDAQTLENMEKVTTLVVDKTGTLTQGTPTLSKLISFNDFNENETLRYAASLEQASEHPLAQAIVNKALEEKIKLIEVKNFNAVTGKGIQGEIENKKVHIGSEAFLNGLNISTDTIVSQADTLRQEGNTVILMAIDFKLAGMLCIADPIKESSHQAIESLKKEGIEVVMLSGDNETTALAVAKKLNITKVYANVLPEQKAIMVKRLQEEGAIVAMAGDGINDAPALAQADVGIAMGTGTDVAIDSAGITLIKGDLLGIVRIRKISHATMRNIRQNLFFAFVYNSAGIPIAAGLLYPFFGILLSPIIAAAAMSLSSVSVISNALRLRSTSLD